MQIMVKYCNNWQIWNVDYKFILEIMFFHLHWFFFFDVFQNTLITYDKQCPIESIFLLTKDKH